MSVETIEVEEREDGMRLDRWFRARFPDVAYGYLQKLLRTGQVRVDSKRAEANARLAAGSKVRVPAIVRDLKERAAGSGAPALSKADRDAIERMILYEDDDVLVLNKPFGLAVQGGTGTRRHIDGMLAAMRDRFGDRPRLVHRLDRDTTGVLLVAKHRDAAAKLGRTFQTRSAAKTYWALVKGVPRPPQGRIEAALVKASGPDGDRVRRARPGEQEEAMHATTHYAVIDRVAHKASWVSLEAGDRAPASAARPHGADRPPDRGRQQIRGRERARQFGHRAETPSPRPPYRHPASLGAWKTRRHRALAPAYAGLLGTFGTGRDQVR